MCSSSGVYLSLSLSLSAFMSVTVHARVFVGWVGWVGVGGQVWVGVVRVRLSPGLESIGPRS